MVIYCFFSSSYFHISFSFLLSLPLGPNVNSWNLLVVLLFLTNIFNFSSSFASTTVGSKWAVSSLSLKPPIWPSLHFSAFHSYNWDSKTQNACYFTSDFFNPFHCQPANYCQIWFHLQCNYHAGISPLFRRTKIISKLVKTKRHLCSNNSKCCHNSLKASRLENVLPKILKPNTIFRFWLIQERIVKKLHSKLCI